MGGACRSAGAYANFHRGNATDTLYHQQKQGVKGRAMRRDDQEQDRATIRFLYLRHFPRLENLCAGWHLVTTVIGKGGIAIQSGY